MEKKWKAELTDVLGRCIQNQDKNIWIARVLGLMDQELDKAREEGKREVLQEQVNNLEEYKRLHEEEEWNTKDIYMEVIDDILEPMKSELSKLKTKE